MAAETKINNKIRLRIRRLLIAKKLGALADFESDELDQLLDIYPEMDLVHQKLMNDAEVAHKYRAHTTNARETSERAPLLWRKSVQSFVGRNLNLVKVAAVATPVILGGIWLLWSQSMNETPLPSEQAMYAGIGADEWLEQIDLSESVDENEDVNQQLGVTNEMVSESSLSGDTVNIPSDKSFSSDEKEFLVILEDGTEMHLGYNTTLTYPQRFKGKTREVRLVGEAYVKVVKDKRPFIIHTPNGKVQQFGTSFHIAALPDSKKTEVVLVEGSVGLLRNGSEHPMAMLKPGEKATFGDGDDIEVRGVDLLPYTTWDKGYILFEKMRLDRLLKVLAHWYCVEVNFKNDSDRSLTVTGSFRRKYDLSDIIQSLSITSGLEMRLEDDQIVVGKTVPRPQTHRGISQNVKM